MMRNYRFTTCWPDRLGAKTVTAIWYWFICSVISTFMPKRNGLCETANSSTTENWQWKTQMRAEQSRKRRRSRAVRDVLKLCALRGARTVSRGGSRSNTTLLPDRQSGGAPVGPTSARSNPNALSDSTWVHNTPELGRNAGVPDGFRAAETAFVYLCLAKAAATVDTTQPMLLWYTVHRIDASIYSSHYRFDRATTI